MASLYQYTNKLTFEQSGSYNFWYLSSSAARSSKNFASSLSYWPWKTVNIGNELTKRMYLEHQILKLQTYSQYKKTVIRNEMISKKAEIFCTKKENCWPIKKQIKASFQEQRFFIGCQVYLLYRWSVYYCFQNLHQTPDTPPWVQEPMSHYNKKIKKNLEVETRHS